MTKVSICFIVVTNATSQASRKIIAYAAENSDMYPTTLTIAGINNTEGLQYFYDNNSTPKKFGLTATNGNISYFVSNEVTSPRLGGYTGHGVNGQAAITNLSTNPNFETSSANISPVWSASISRVTTSALTGGYGMRVNCAAGGNTDCGVNIGNLADVEAGKTYTYQLTLRAQTTTAFASYVSGNAGTTSKIYSPNLNPGDTWSIKITKEATGTGNPIWYVLRTTTSATSYDFDSMMVTEGSTGYNFADGSSDNWKWNGTAQVSTSTGSGSPL